MKWQPYEVNGTYGSAQIPCNVFCMDTHHGTWYAVEGSCNVNLSPEPLEEGVDVEEIQDLDGFTWPDGVHTLDELEKSVEA
jgi:hypothetical protein